MKPIMKKLREIFSDGLYMSNRKAAYRRNRTILRTLLIAAIICMILLFAISFVFENYVGMRWMYPIILALCVIMLVLSAAVGDRTVTVLIYIVHFFFVGFCTYSSAFIFPDYVSIMVLAEMLIFPALMLDRSTRIIGISVITGVLYLLVISAFKQPQLFMDEMVNVTGFTLLGGIVGSFTRKTQLEYFESMKNLRISSEKYLIAIAHNHGVICEFDVGERCVSMKSDVAELFAVPLKCYGVPYEPVKLGSIGKGSEKAYIAFYEAIINGEKTGSAEFESRTVNGWRWQHAVFTTIFSDDGKPLSAVISFYDITDQRAEEQAQRRRAEQDGLTGILNRAAAEAAINAAIPGGGVFILADLDNLKTINDTLGHPQGDAALRALAKSLSEGLGESCIVGRVGGDEFAALIKGEISRDALEAILEKTQKLLADVRIGDKSDHTIGASIGAVRFEANGIEDFGILYRKADAALYGAKKAGKGTSLIEG